jgi:hypothetical protein
MATKTSTDTSASIEPTTVPDSGAASTSVDPAPELGFVKHDAIDPPIDFEAE